MSYRIYIRYGESSCLRFTAPGYGEFTEHGIQLLEWIQNPLNITKLRHGLQHVYEVDKEELERFLEFELRKIRGYTEDSEDWEDCEDSEDSEDWKGSEGDELLAALIRQYDKFSSLKTGVEKLEVISNATESTVIPRTLPRKRSDGPEWLYLLNLDQETFEVYQFREYRPRERTHPRTRLTITSLRQWYRRSSPGYHMKLKLSELQSMSQAEWLASYNNHDKVLDELWKQNVNVLQTITHADTIPFTILSRRERLTHAKLAEASRVINGRQPSKVPIFEEGADLLGWLEEARLYPGEPPNFFGGPRFIPHSPSCSCQSEE